MNESYKLLMFLKELRESADIIYKIFTSGSCFKLFLIVKSIFDKAEPYWSDRDNHCIIKLDNEFFDIGGEISSKYVEDRNYYLIPDGQLHGYSLLKYTSNQEDRVGIDVEKYSKAS